MSRWNENMSAIKLTIENFTSLKNIESPSYIWFSSFRRFSEQQGDTWHEETSD